MFKRFGKVIVTKNGKVKLKNKLRSLEQLVQAYKQDLKDERMNCQTITEKFKKVDNWARKAKRFVKLAIRWTAPWLSREKAFMPWKDLSIDGCLALWQLEHESVMELKQSMEPAKKIDEPQSDLKMEKPAKEIDEPQKSMELKQSMDLKMEKPAKEIDEPQSDLKMEKPQSDLKMEKPKEKPLRRSTAFIIHTL
jgi:hypothetical protein